VAVGAAGTGRWLAVIDTNRAWCRALRTNADALVGNVNSLAMDPFVSFDWLREHRDEVLLADVRWYGDGRAGRAGYEQSHIPGALYVELEEALSGPGEAADHGRHPLPTPERFAAGLAAAGIGDGDTVIAYDDAGGVIAARLVWMLRASGHQAALLDGGLGAWPAEELVSGPVARADGPPTGAATQSGATHFTPTPWPAELLVDIDGAAQAAADGSAVLIDARPADRFAGAPDALDPQAGHIPGARSVPTREHLSADGTIADAQTLRARFAAAGIEPGTAVISYCGSGVTACHNLLALERAGLGAGRLFSGSWSQWSRDSSRPIATGPDTGGRAEPDELP
jgi:thiosulfate/3-mercaptopyruvate sulfurtransferase